MISKSFQATIAAVALTVSAQAAVNFTDDFEDGTFPGTVWGGDTGAFSESTGNLNTVTNALGFGNQIGVNTVSFNPATDPIIQLSLDFFRAGNTGADSNDFIGLAILNSANTQGYGVRVNAGSGAVLTVATIGESTNFDSAFNALGSHSTGTFLGITPGVNYRLTLDYDFTTGAASAILRNLDTSTNVLTMTAVDNTPVTALSHFGIYTGGGEGVAPNFDYSIRNFSASAVPEPSAALLGGLGMLGLLMRRRR